MSRTRYLFAKVGAKRRVEFIVSGGGGGPRPTLVTPYYDDTCLALGHCQAGFRPMHYLVLKQHD